MDYLRAGIDKPVTFLSAGNFIADVPWSHVQRIIDSYEIMIGIRGAVYIQQEEEAYVLNEGEVLLLMPGRLHKGYELSRKGTSFYWMHFNCGEETEIIERKIAEEEIMLMKNNPYLNSLNSKILIPTYFKPANMDRIHILSRQLLHINESNYYTGQARDYILTSLLIELTEQRIDCLLKTAVPEALQDHLPRILEWIRIHATEDISLQRVAYEFNYSKEYLARYFKRNMGMSTQEYIHNIRMTKAKELLCRSDKNIKEIAGLLGFRDEKYFMRLFKRYEKITPRSYRRAYNMTHLNNR